MLAFQALTGKASIMRISSITRGEPRSPNGLPGAMGVVIFIAGLAVVEGISSVNWLMVGDYKEAPDLIGGFPFALEGRRLGDIYQGPIC